MEMKQTWLKKLTSSLLAGALALGMAVVPAAAAESNKLVEVDLWHATRNQASMGNVATDNAPARVETEVRCDDKGCKYLEGRCCCADHVCIDECGCGPKCATRKTPRQSRQ